ncbi:CD0519/CD1768 family membrane protein [Sediminitomix flava]|uniref:Nucleoside recognition protein n=1 Tax=Sediminitomix flava TaxID=379075 RepID=A0A315ZAN1_SEDFL|nr:hypothetical protein [Sediminitomix flava]PWJ42635.1 hypothetical protein BC781_102179 [Sediminitomix flava]
MTALERVKKDFIKNRRYEAFIFLIVFFGVFGFLANKMGAANLLQTLMNSAWDLLTNTVFYIMGITVLSGALGKLFVEFGVIRLLELVLAPLMRPLFGLPGVAALAGVMTFLSDNPAIISLAKDKSFSKYFTKSELLSLTNFGTAFGMGLIVITYMIGFGYFGAAMIGLVGAVFGSIISTRLVQYLLRDVFSKDETTQENGATPEHVKALPVSFKSEGGVFLRTINAILDGGKNGVDLGLAIIPGVLVISTMVMMFTNGPQDSAIGYQGLAYEGVPVLPWIAGKFSFLFKFLFGFEHGELIAFPITSLGAVGAALSILKSFVAQNMITGNEIAVFTAMGMCWSGYLSTHTAMLDTLGHRELTSKALIAHTVGGLCAGVIAHYLFLVSQFI